MWRKRKRVKQVRGQGKGEEREEVKGNKERDDGWKEMIQHKQETIPIAVKGLLSQCSA